MPVPKKYLALFKANCHYHVYNRSIGDRILFNEEKNYFFFLGLIKKHLLPTVEIYAYSLLPNHFHLFIKVPESNEEDMHQKVSNCFRSMFIAYTNSLNSHYNKHGGLFQTPFRRILIDSDEYFTQLLYYIHYNAVHHQITNSLENYRWSSYQSILLSSPTLLQRGAVLEWFGGKELFIKYHRMQHENYTGDMIIE